jgi:hypothetical protein
MVKRNFPFHFFGSFFAWFASVFHFLFALNLSFLYIMKRSLFGEGVVTARGREGQEDTYLISKCASASWSVDKTQAEVEPVMFIVIQAYCK